MTWVVTAVAASAISTGLSVIESRKSTKAQRKANDVSRKIEARQAQRERLAALREAQIARATSTQQAATAGTVDSSGFAGQQAGITTQTASNIAFSQQVQSGAEVVGMYNQKAADASVRSANWGALAQLSLASASFAAPAPTQTTPTKTP